MNFQVNDIAEAIAHSMDIELQENFSIEELNEKLAAYIHHLINHDFNKLISILYRIDINEQKLKQMIEENPEGDTGLIIAGLILERQQQKLRSKELFRQQGENKIDENEKW